MKTQNIYSINSTIGLNLQMLKKLKLAFIKGKR